LRKKKYECIKNPEVEFSIFKNMMQIYLMKSFSLKNINKNNFLKKFTFPKEW